MAVTIKDVARRANVGVGTVSRVLNGGCVNDKTRELVLKAKQHGASPAQEQNGGYRRTRPYNKSSVFF